MQKVQADNDDNDSKKKDLINLLSYIKKTDSKTTNKKGCALADATANYFRIHERRNSN